MSGVFESRHDHYLIRIFTFVRRLLYQNLVLLDSPLVQVTPEIHAISLIDKIGHDSTVYPHHLSHINQFEIRIEIWFLLRQIVFEYPLVQLSACVVRRKALFGTQTVVYCFLFVETNRMFCKRDIVYG